MRDTKTEGRMLKLYDSLWRLTQESQLPAFELLEILVVLKHEIIFDKETRFIKQVFSKKREK